MKKTITATDGTHTFVAVGVSAAWTHAVITAYGNGYTGVNWAKSAASAMDLAEHKRTYIAALTAAEKAADPAYPISSIVVETTTTDQDGGAR